jgi:hypothetical protein
MHELTCIKKCKMSDWSAIPTVLPERQTDKWKALRSRVKAANVPTWAQRTQESIWESWGEVGDWAGKRVMECGMSTEHDKGRGGLGKAVAVKVAEVQNMAGHVLRIALVLWLSGHHLNWPCNSGEATK